ncbi:hypothetical protein MPSEU_000056800 [Mayamaea pseudoterrestris]|nr:hypothetical protein MPSEU_000056800 [Mayamaea pseudoterrestris]
MTTSSAPTNIRLITNKMCPYAQKAWIALEASDTPFQLEEIPLYGTNGKPEWFRKLNPAGTVPVFVANDGDLIIPDSDLILDAFEDDSNLGSIPLFNSENQSQIQQWRSTVNKNLIPIGKNSVLSGRSMSNELQKVLEELNAMVVGPYLAGNLITTADCHAFPFLWRLNDEYRLDDYPSLQQWLNKCSKEQAFSKTIQSSWWWWWW